MKNCETFQLSLQTKLVAEDTILMQKEAVKRAVERMYRDMNKVFTKAENQQNELCLIHQPELMPESFRIEVACTEKLRIYAADELGVIYAFHYLSEVYLGILPFWFWMDQQIVKKKKADIPFGITDSLPMAVRFRGWFINDEVLIDNWKKEEGKNEYIWEMALEALLRCGGNMVIAGTDRNSVKNRRLVSDMGLYITHHHAEPLGAEMFSRAYPDTKPSFAEHPELYRKLWREGIESQRGYKVIWNISFRGQGDCPFWANAPEYDTPQKRGELLSRLIKEQYELVKSYDAGAYCCTYLYGEIMQLYQEGLVSLPDGVIKVWSDNGYGKMVSRRQDNHNPRIPALPSKREEGRGHHGVYYHVSFYDLQAANHITMLPNSLQFVERELKEAYKLGVKDYWIINSSNIRPHVFYLDAIRKLWQGACIRTTGDDQFAQSHARDFCRKYFGEQIAEQVSSFYLRYPECTAAYGEKEDEHAGEQLYNYVVRGIASQWMSGNHEDMRELLWTNAGKRLNKQASWLYRILDEPERKFTKLYKDCSELHEKLLLPAKVKEDTKTADLLRSTILLQAGIHMHCIRGARIFAESYTAFEQDRKLKCFYLLGLAAQEFEQADCDMRSCEYGVWKDFYENECLTDVKFTAYLLRELMAYVRNLGDGPHFFDWQRKVLLSKMDRRVMLITNMMNHQTDEELFIAMKNNQDFLEDEEGASE